MHINIIQQYTGPVKFNSLTVVKMLSHSVASTQSSNPNCSNWTPFCLIVL